MSSRLAALLRHARDHVPYYQRDLADVLITDANAYDIMHAMPVLRREDVAAHRPRLWSACGDTTQWRSVRTTGVTGTPVEILLDLDAQRAERIALHRHIAAVFGVPPHSAWQRENPHRW